MGKLSRETPPPREGEPMGARPGETTFSSGMNNNFYHLVVQPRSPLGPAHSTKLGCLLSPGYLTPQTSILNNLGQPKCGKDGRPYLRYLQANEYKTKLVIKWTTQGAVYSKIPAQYRKVVNAVKSFASEEGQESLLVYHLPQREHAGDACVQGAIGHLHSITANDNFVKMSRQPHYRSLARHAKNSSFTTYSQSLPDQEAVKRLCSYLKKPGYDFFGTNSVRLGKMYFKAEVTHKVLNPEELVEDVDEDVDELDGGAFGLDTINGYNVVSFDDVVERPNAPSNPFEDSEAADMTFGRRKRPVPSLFEDSDDDDSLPTLPFKRQTSISRGECLNILTKLLEASNAKNERALVKWVLSHRQHSDQIIQRPDLNDVNSKMGQFSSLYKMAWFRDVLQKSLVVSKAEPKKTWIEKE